MPPSEVRDTPQFSLIDRLSYDGAGVDHESLQEPERGKQLLKVHSKSMVRAYENSVKRDIEWLFNTRRTVDERVDDYPQLNTSVYAYGLPDITSVNVGSVRDQRELLRLMKRSLELFEPRLREVDIDFEPLTGSTKSLQFRISGVLLMDPAPQTVCINTVLDPVNAKYEVK